MELEEYLRVKLGDPMKWESWTYCMNRNGRRLEHTPGAGSIALHSTDALRFATCCCTTEVERQATGPGGIRGRVLAAVAVQSALSLQPDVRSEPGRPRREGPQGRLL